MPAPANKQPGDILYASEWNTLATTANNGESGAASAQTTATNALNKANAAYVKDALGIDVGEMSAPVQAVLTGALVVSTSTTRPAVSNPVLFSTTSDPGTNAVAGKDFFVGDIAP